LEPRPRPAGNPKLKPLTDSDSVWVQRVFDAAGTTSSDQGAKNRVGRTKLAISRGADEVFNAVLQEKESGADQWGSLAAPSGREDAFHDANFVVKSRAESQRVMAEGDETLTRAKLAIDASTAEEAVALYSVAMRLDPTNASASDKCEQAEILVQVLEPERPPVKHPL